MNLTCIIVEDLTVAAEYLQKCCEKEGHIQVLSRFTNIKDAVSFLNENLVDLIFLDVEMPEEFGYDLLDQIGYSPKVIITTSKPEYAYHGFEYNVTDFLKKPFTYPRFTEAIKKVITAIESTNKEKGEDHIYIKTEGKLIRLQNTDVLYIESMGDYVKFVTSGKKYVTLNTIKNLEEKVNKQVFMKIHRSFIINMSKVENIRENALFIQGTEIPISKANKSEVMKRINVI
jgi:DNA-binding LytR/AlgR family response regulator